MYIHRSCMFDRLVVKSCINLRQTLRQSESRCIKLILAASSLIQRCDKLQQSTMDRSKKFLVNFQRLNSCSQVPKCTHQLASRCINLRQVHQADSNCIKLVTFLFPNPFAAKTVWWCSEYKVCCKKIVQQTRNIDTG